jgi:hypothetical protein
MLFHIRLLLKSPARITTDSNPIDRAGRPSQRKRRCNTIAIRGSGVSGAETVGNRGRSTPSRARRRTRKRLT